jgi:hypothetical protein
MEKMTGVQVEMSFTLSLAQVKQLALTPPGDIIAVRQAVGEVVTALLNHPSAKVQPYLKWLPKGYFDDEDYNWFWKKYDENPWKSLEALQELAQHQYGVLDQIVEATDSSQNCGPVE